MSNAALQAVEVLPASEPKSSNPITPMDMLDKAISTGANIEVLEKLMALNERWERSQARKAFDEAMSKAKAEIPVILKNRTVDFTSQKGRTNYQYEDLGEIARTVDPILSKHGLSYRYRTSAGTNEPVSVTCIVSHRLGHFEENTLVAGRDDSGNKNHIQQIGSTLTYLQRMTLKAALGLAAAEDDDGQKSEEVGGPIGHDQVSKVLALIEETDTDIAKFCQYRGVEAVPEITTAQLPRALAMLEKKQKARANG